jgi:hypothetical protein
MLCCYNLVICDWTRGDPTFPTSREEMTLVTFEALPFLVSFQITFTSSYAKTNAMIYIDSCDRRRTQLFLWSCQSTSSNFPTNRFPIWQLSPTCWCK